MLAPGVDLEDLASRTKNYTGAEIEAVCRSATSFALFKDTDLSQITTKDDEEQKTNGKNGFKSVKKPTKGAPK